LENITYYHPFYKRTGKVILADYVSIDNGTGLVHNAPDHGSDDYIACKKYKIDPFEPIDKFGNFTSVINDNELIGKFYNDTNEIIINRLKKSNCLLCQNKIIHSAAVD
jgi:isoleucyl-tRNA synthetase